MRNYYKYTLLIVFAFCTHIINAQKQTILVDADFQNTSLEEAINHFNTKYPVQIFYNASMIQGKTVTIKFEQANLDNALNALLEKVNLTFIKYSDGLYVISLPNYATAPKQKKEKKNYKIQGEVYNSESGKVLTGANVFIEELKRGVITNGDGAYEITLPEGEYTISVSSMGLETHRQKLILDENRVLNFTLYTKIVNLDGVTVFGEKPDRNIRSIDVGMAKLTAKTIKRLPNFMGETDIIKSISTMPGVSTAGDLASGFNVRGGGYDQNLIIIDNAQVLNPTHLFGFFSGFNSDAINNVELYKGAIPSKYGGRLSSILDIEHKTANFEKVKGYGGIGLISSRATFEIPVIKDKSSLLVSGRSTYSDWILKRLPNEDIRRSRAYFYDASMKYQHNINSKNKIYLTAYHSQDGFKFAFDTLFNWGVSNANLRYVHTLNEKVLVSFNATYSNNESSIKNLVKASEFKLGANVEQLSGNINVTWMLNENNLLNFGAQSTHYNINPGKLVPSNDSSEVNTFFLKNEYGLESSVYAENEMDLSDKISLRYGLRYTQFSKLGPDDVYSYTQGFTRELSKISDTLSYGKNEIIKTFRAFEPRISARYSIDNSSSVKLSYNRTNQFFHLISNTSVIKPYDIWKLSDEHIKPLVADQFSVGYFKNLNHNQFETSVEVYYKNISQLVDYKYGAKLILNDNIETELIDGKGYAYGAEFFLRKTRGRLTGWTSYTLSKAKRKTVSSIREEIINGGDYYLSEFDKPHNLNIVAHYQYNKRISYSANFTLSSGRPISYPVAKYDYMNRTVPIYSERNSHRLPAYHRLDISITIDGSLKKKKKWHGNYTFSIYNVYARKNTFSYFFVDRGYLIQGYKLSVLGTAFPSFTYNFRF